jgi:RHS repeat-associated protein
MLAANANGTPLRDLAFRFDASSRVQEMIDGRPHIEAAFRHSSTYSYDDRYRLVSMSNSAGTTTWTYDDNGNIRSESLKQADRVVDRLHEYGGSGAGPDALTRLGNESITYDGAGRVIQDGTRSFEWDAKGRLARVQTPEVTEEYVYDHADRRVIKSTTEQGQSVITRYVDEDVEERDGKMIRYVVLNKKRIARLGASSPAPMKSSSGAIAVVAFLLCSIAAMVSRIRNRWNGRGGKGLLLVASLAMLLSCAHEKGTGTLRDQSLPITEWPSDAIAYLTDHLNSPVALIDAAGEVTQEVTYNAYGTTRAKRGVDENPFLYASLEMDPTGLGDFGARPYRHDAGIFLAPDPLSVVPSGDSPRFLPSYA